jgi:phosphatidate cytidylyltransferase
VDEHEDRDDLLSQRSAGEGVRIIRAEEAQAALDAGQAEGRRPDNAPRFGDVPPPPPSGPRPAHRFPLPDSVDPAEVAPRPPVRIDEVRASARPPRYGEPPPPPAEAPTQWKREDEVPFDPGDSWAPPGRYDDSRNDSGPHDAGRNDSGRHDAPDLRLPDEGLTVGGGPGPDLPHWSDPPTGQVPLIQREGRTRGEQPPEDDLAAWQALGTRGLRWRDGKSDWDDLDDVGSLGDDDEPRLGALDTTRSEHSDMFSFDEQFERLEEGRTGQHSPTSPGLGQPPSAAATAAAASAAARGRSRPGSTGPDPARPGNGRSEGRLRPPVPPASGGGGRDLASALGVGIALMAALLITYAVGSAVLMLFVTVVVTASALELFNLMQHRGFRPANLLGLCATVAVMLAAYWRGEQALPLVVALVFVTSMLWYMMHVVDARPVVNAALTVLGFVWVGVFGSYASLLLRAHHGKNLFLLAILVTVAADVLAYAAGSSFGSHSLAPNISPHKTWEGTIVGGIGAVFVSVLLAKLFLHNTWSIKHALVLGIVVAIVGPIGDLCESMVKRDLDLKDSGTVLPGHGGLLDRFDAVLFVLPATYYLAQYFKLL